MYYKYMHNYTTYNPIWSGLFDVRYNNINSNSLYLGRFIRKSAKTNKKKQGRQEYQHKKIMR